jgi:hypothetical protein
MFRIVNLQEIIKSENTELVLSKIAEFSSLNEDETFYQLLKKLD